jgi:hypothetical protein
MGRNQAEYIQNILFFVTIEPCHVYTKEELKMPLIHMKEIYTPLRLLRIKLFRSKEGQTYIKIGSKPRKRLFGGKQDVSY